MAQAPLRAARPLKITKITVTEVHPKQEPQDTRDYVIVQIFTDQGIVGTTMDGDCKLPKGIAAEVLKRAEPYFIGKDPFDVALHNVQDATVHFIKTAEQRGDDALKFYELGFRAPQSHRCRPRQDGHHGRRQPGGQAQDRSTATTSTDSPPLAPSSNA